MNPDERIPRPSSLIAIIPRAVGCQHIATISSEDKLSDGRWSSKLVAVRRRVHSDTTDSFFVNGKRGGYALFEGLLLRQK